MSRRRALGERVRLGGGSVLAVLIPLCATSPAAAQSAARDDTFVLGEVEVIGRREASATEPATDTVSAETIFAQHRDDLAEALDLVPGVSVQNLGQRRERLIFVRGFSSRQVPLFIDGVPVYVPYDGNVDLARFGVDYVSQIVVSKGLASLLYGPNILGGAVNVVSRKPTKPFEASARVSSEMDEDFGSLDERVVGWVGGTSEAWYAHATASYVTSDGYRLPADYVPVAAENGDARENADSSDFVVSAKVGFTPNADNEFALSYYRQNGEKDDPPYSGSYVRAPTRPDGVQVRFWQWPYWDKESIYLVGRNALAERGTLRWRVFHDSFQNSLESYDDATYTTQTRPFAFHGSNYDDYTFGGSADFEWSWNDDNTTRAAAHYRQDVHRESQIAPALPEQRLEIPTYDVAVEHEWRAAPGLAFTGSYSHMIQPEETVQVYNSGTATFSPVQTDRASADNAQLIGTLRLGDQHRLHAGLSLKTRFPTLKERFSGGLGSVVPNPTLDAETAAHYEVGYGWDDSDWSLKLALYQSDLEDAIQSITLAPTSCTAPPCSQLQNIGEQRNRGVEFSFAYALSTLKISGQVNVVDVENLTNPEIQPINVPKFKYLLVGDWQFLPQWHLRVDGQNEASRFSNSTGTREAEDFTLVNAFLRFSPVEAMGIEVGVRNIGDELYAYEEGFYEAGRSWLAQLDYRW